MGESHGKHGLDDGNPTQAEESWQKAAILVYARRPGREWARPRDGLIERAGVCILQAWFDGRGDWRSRLWESSNWGERRKSVCVERMRLFSSAEGGGGGEGIEKV